MKKRVIFYFLSIIFMVALSGCQKKLRVVNSPPMPQPSGYDKTAHIIVDLCDPEQSELLKSKSELSNHAFVLCSAGMRKMEKDLHKIRSEQLKKLIMKYKESRSKED